MAANNNKKNDTNLSFNIKGLKDICSKYKKYIATGAMLVLLAVVIQNSSAASKDTDTSNNNVSGTETADDASDGEKFQVDAYPEINELFEQYYVRYASGDTEALSEIAYPISETEKSFIEWYSKHVEEYDNIKCYSKKGVSDGEYIVMVASETKFKGVETGAPELESFYVRTDENGTVYIDNIYSRFNERQREYTSDQAVNTLITEYCENEDVVNLEREVHEEFEKALEKDEALKEMVTSTVQTSVAEWVATFNDEQDGNNGEDGNGTSSGSEKGNSSQTVEKYTAHITSDGVNMRKKRSTDSSILQTLDKNTKVTVYGESKNGWYKIKYNDETGFVSEDYVKIDESETDNKDKTNNNENNNDNNTDAKDNQTVEKRTAYVKSDGVNMRKKRSTDSEVIQALDAGTEVTVYGESKNGWYKVKCNGKTGFISEDYVVSDKSKVEKEDDSNSSTNKRIAYAKKGVNMRKSRSTDSEIIKTLKAGTKVMIYGKSKNGWFKVRSKGKFGYVKKEYIVSDKSKVVKEEEPAQEPTTQAPSYYNEGDRITLSDSVNVRQSMSENADRVGLAYKGDVLTVIMSYVEGWTKVSWNGQTGYVKTELLK